MKRILLAMATLASAFFLVACATSPLDPGAMSEVTIQIRAGSYAPVRSPNFTYTPNDANNVVLVASNKNNGNVTNSAPVSVVGGSATVSIFLPAGTYILTAKIFAADGTLIYSGSKEANVQPGIRTTVPLTATQVTIGSTSTTGQVSLSIGLQGLIYWNRFETIGASEIPATYGDGNVTLTPYGSTMTSFSTVSSVFGNGMRPDPSSRGLLYLYNSNSANPSFSLSKAGTIEFWYTPDSGFVENPVENPDSPFSTFFHVAQGYENFNASFQKTAPEGQKFRLILPQGTYIAASESNFSVGNPTHLAFVWDNQSAGGIESSGNNYQLFIDGALKGSAQSSVVQNSPFIYFGGAYYNGAKHDTIRGTIDNLKIYSIPKTDFSDRFDE